MTTSQTPDVRTFDLGVIKPCAYRPCDAYFESTGEPVPEGTSPCACGTRAELSPDATAISRPSNDVVT